MNKNTLLIIAFFFSASVMAAGNCSDNGICAGDKSFAFYKGSIHAGVVKNINPDGTISFQVDGEARPTEFKEINIAVTKAGRCAPRSPAICIGKNSKREDRTGNEVSGKISGYFLTGYAVVTEGRTTESYPVQSIQAVDADHDDLKDAVQTAQKALDKAHDRAAKVTDCPPDKGGLAPLDALEARVKAGESPRLREYLKLWYPSKKDEGTPPNPWLACRDSSQYNHPAKHDASGELLSACQPDTLYSWGPMQKIHDLEKKIGDGNWQPRPFFNDALFLSITPAASFGYGSNDNSGGYTIRVKLKPGVKTKFVRGSINCAGYPPAEAANTVYIRIFMNDHGAGKQSSGEDFVICDSHVVHSWSYGTKEGYDELSRDVSYIIDPAHKNEWFSYMRRPDASGTFQPALWELGSDQHPFSTEQLSNSFKRLLDLSSQNEGHVYVNPDVSGTAAKKRADHFKTENKTWFNPK